MSVRGYDDDLPFVTLTVHEVVMCNMSISIDPSEDEFSWAPLSS
jgi:hypothetical protein